MKGKNRIALIALLCGMMAGTAYAMPMGGTVTQGSVSLGADTLGVNGTISSVSSGATITANANSVINWNAFGIGSGEKLSFDTTNGALLNRVTGTDVSAILGTLTQSGNNPLFLVNPNGIVVGGGAVIDASSLVLSTLALSDEDFEKVLQPVVRKNNDYRNLTGGTFVTPEGKTIAETLSVDKGAKINIDSLLLMLGGKVTVADGVDFAVENKNPSVTSWENTSHVEVMAAKNYETASLAHKDGQYDQWDAESEGPIPPEYYGDNLRLEAVPENQVSFHGTVNNLKTPDNYLAMDVAGGNLNLNRAKFDLTDNAQLFFHGQSMVDYRKDDGVANAEYGIYADGLNVNGGRGGDMEGGTVTLKNSTLSFAPKTDMETGVVIGAYQKSSEILIDDKQPDWQTYFEADDNNRVLLDHTKITVDDTATKNHDHWVYGSGVQLTGGKVVVKDSAVSYQGTTKESGIAFVAARRGEEERKPQDGIRPAYYDVLTMQPENSVQISGSTVEAPEIQLFGGTLSAEKSTLAAENGKLLTVAANQVKVLNQDEPLNEFVPVTVEDIDATKDNTLVKDAATTLSALDTQSSNWTTQGDLPALDPTPDPKPEPEPTPTPDPTPQPKPDQPTPPASDFGAVDAQNIAIGERDAAQLLRAPSLIAQQKAFGAYVHGTLSLGSGTERARAGVILGLLDGIRHSASLTDAEKQILQLTVLNAYEPAHVQEENAQRQTTQREERPAGSSSDREWSEKTTTDDAPVVLFQ